MKALVVDDDPSTRRLLARILQRNFRAEVHEAGDGLEGLDLLSKERFDVVLLDIVMPVLDGVEMLAAIRASPQYGDIPVMMLSAVREEQQIREAIKLGIGDYVSKPLRVVETSQRLARFIGSLGSRPPSAQARSRRPSAGMGANVVLVDGDEKFRRFFGDCLDISYPVQTFAHGTRALIACRANRPAAIFVGQDIGLMGADLFAAKVRGIPELAGVRLVAVVPKGTGAAPQAGPAFDGTIVRTFLTQSFTHSATRWLSDRPAARSVLAEHPDIRQQVVAASEQLFGMMLSTELRLVEAPVREGAAPDRLVRVTIDVGTRPGALAFELRCREEVARSISGRMLGVEPAQVGDDDMMGSLQEIANIVTGRIQNSLKEDGTHAACSLPEVLAGPLPPPPQGEAMEFAFASVPGDIAFDIVVAATDPPAQAPAHELARASA